MPLAAANEAYEQQGNQAHSAATSLFTVIGQAKALGGGHAAFMGKAIVLSATSACVFGLGGYMLGSLPWLGLPASPILGFLAGTQLGFTSGLLTRWLADKQAAIRAVEEYPTLMHHHLRLSEPTAYGCKTSIEDFKYDLNTNLLKQGMAVVAYYSAMEAISRLRDEQEERVVAAILAAQAGLEGQDAE